MARKVASVKAWSAYRTLTITGGVVGGLGLGILGTGILLLAGNADAHRYDVKPSGQRLAGVRVLRMVWPGGVGMVGRF